MGKRGRNYKPPEIWQAVKGGDRFYRMFHSLFRSEGYRALSLEAKAIYNAMCDQWNPVKPLHPTEEQKRLPDNAVYLTYDQIREALGMNNMSGVRIGKFIRELEFFGFIVIVHGEGRGRKSMNMYMFSERWKKYRSKEPASFRKKKWKEQCDAEKKAKARGKSNAEEQKRLEKLHDENKKVLG